MPHPGESAMTGIIFLSIKQDYDPCPFFFLNFRENSKEILRKNN